MGLIPSSPPGRKPSPQPRPSYRDYNCSDCVLKCGHGSTKNRYMNCPDYTTAIPSAGELKPLICKQCGAPLKEIPTDNYVKCGSCGVVSYIGGHAPRVMATTSGTGIMKLATTISGTRWVVDDDLKGRYAL